MRNVIDGNEDMFLGYFSEVLTSDDESTTSPGDEENKPEDETEIPTATIVKDVNTKMEESEHP